MTADEKYQLRKDTGYFTRGLIWYTLVLSIIMSMFVAAILLGAGSEKASIDQIYSNPEYVGYGSITAVLFGVIFLFLRNSLHKKKINIFAKSIRKMTLKKIGEFMILFLMVQFILNILANLMEIILNTTGYTMSNLMEMAEMDSGIGMLIYGGFVGPIVEEIIYRGFILKGLLKYGKIFALIVSSVLFGIMHGHPIQILLGTVVGMILGYVALEFSLRWSILLHIINNFLISCVFVSFIDQFSESLSNILFFGILGLAFIIGIILLVKKRKNILTYFHTQTAPMAYYVNAFTTLSAIIFIFFNLLSAIQLIADSIKPL